MSLDLYGWLRVCNVIFSAISGLGYLYIDRYMFRLARFGKLSGGELVARMGRIVFLIATANATGYALLADKPPWGPGVIGLFIGLLWVTTGVLLMSRDAWELRHLPVPTA